MRRLALLLPLLLLVNCGASYNSRPMTGSSGKQATATWNVTGISWGLVQAGASMLDTVTVRNSGAFPLTGTVRLGSTCSPAFSIVSGGGAYTLAPGAARSVVLRFAPTDSMTTTYNCSVESR